MSPIEGGGEAMCSALLKTAVGYGSRSLEGSGRLWVPLSRRQR